MPAVCCPRCLKQYPSHRYGPAARCGVRLRLYLRPQSQRDTQRLAELIERGEPDDMEEIAHLLGPDDPSQRK